MLWSGRNPFELFKIAIALAERQARQAQFRQDGFSLYSMPIKNWKAYKTPRDLSTLQYIITHVTAVNGGFGVSRQARRRWERQLGDDTLLASTGYPLIDHQLTEAGIWIPRPEGFEPLGDETALTIARRLGLWERYRGSVPYHQIAAANGDVLLNRELEHRTWHANSGNFGVGFAVDCGPDEQLDGWMIETGRQALRVLYARVIAASEKARRDGVRIAPHRCFSGSRRRDTNVTVHREIVLPVVRETAGLDVDYHIRKDKGLPIPDDWDPSALYDHRGNKIH